MISEIEPVYFSDETNSSLILDKSEVEITTDGGTVQGTATASLHPLPRCQFTISVELPPCPASIVSVAGQQQVKMRYGSAKQDVSVFVLSASFSSSSTAGVSLELMPDSGRLILCNDRQVRLQSVTAHILNFPEFFSTGPGRNDLHHTMAKGGSMRLGCFALSDADWHIEVQAMPATSQLVKQLKAEGGYAITHVARITGQGGRTFTIKALERLLWELHLFLSFARGQWTPVFGVVGFDKAGTQVYRNWGMQNVAPWETRFSWFDIHNAQCLTELFPGLIALIRHPVLGETASHALYWYLRSNRGGSAIGVDSGIILSQAALERIATQYLRSVGQSIPKKAAETMRRACKHLNVPTAIPKHTTSLLRASNKTGWQDSLHAITQIRNELVHPDTKMKVKVGEVVVEGWQLAQWYLELLILRLAGYSGVYSNRINPGWVGQVELMPWARKGGVGRK